MHRFTAEFLFSNMYLYKISTHFQWSTPIIWIYSFRRLYDLC